MAILACSQDHNRRQPPELPLNDSQLPIWDETWLAKTLAAAQELKMEPTRPRPGQLVGQALPGTDAVPTKISTLDRPSAITSMFHPPTPPGFPSTRTAHVSIQYASLQVI